MLTPKQKEDAYEEFRKQKAEKLKETNIAGSKGESIIDFPLLPAIFAKNRIFHISRI